MAATVPPPRIPTVPRSDPYGITLRPQRRLHRLRRNADSFSDASLEPSAGHSDSVSATPNDTFLVSHNTSRAPVMSSAATQKTTRWTKSSSTSSTSTNHEPFLRPATETGFPSMSTNTCTSHLEGPLAAIPTDTPVHRKRCSALRRPHDSESSSPLHSVSLAPDITPYSMIPFEEQQPSQNFLWATPDVLSRSVTTQVFPPSTASTTLVNGPASYHSSSPLPCPEFGWLTSNTPVPQAPVGSAQGLTAQDVNQNTIKHASRSDTGEDKENNEDLPQSAPYCSSVPLASLDNADPLRIPSTQSCKTVWPNPKLTRRWTVVSTPNTTLDPAQSYEPHHPSLERSTTFAHPLHHPAHRTSLLGNATPASSKDSNNFSHVPYVTGVPNTAQSLLPTVIASSVGRDINNAKCGRENTLICKDHSATYFNDAGMLFSPMHNESSVVASPRPRPSVSTATSPTKLSEQTAALLPPGVPLGSSTLPFRNDTLIYNQFLPSCRVDETQPSSFHDSPTPSASLSTHLLPALTNPCPNPSPMTYHCSASSGRSQASTSPVHCSFSPRPEATTLLPHVNGSTGTLQHFFDALLSPTAASNQSAPCPASNSSLSPLLPHHLLNYDEPTMPSEKRNTPHDTTQGSSSNIALNDGPSLAYSSINVQSPKLTRQWGLSAKKRFCNTSLGPGCAPPSTLPWDILPTSYPHTLFMGIEQGNAMDDPSPLSTVSSTFQPHLSIDDVDLRGYDEQSTTSGQTLSTGTSLHDADRHLMQPTAAEIPPLWLHSLLSETPSTPRQVPQETSSIPPPVGERMRTTAPSATYWNPQATIETSQYNRSSPISSFPDPSALKSNAFHAAYPSTKVSCSPSSSIGQGSTPTENVNVLGLLLHSALRHRDVFAPLVPPSNTMASSALYANGIPADSACHTIPPGLLQDALHAQCQCKPCAFFYNKKKGCRNGDSCKFCHHEDHSKYALKQWKKHQQRYLKQFRRTITSLGSS